MAISKPLELNELESGISGSIVNVKVRCVLRGLRLIFKHNFRMKDLK